MHLAPISFCFCHLGILSPQLAIQKGKQHAVLWAQASGSLIGSAASRAASRLNRVCVTKTKQSVWHANARLLADDQHGSCQSTHLWLLVQLAWPPASCSCWNSKHPRMPRIAAMSTPGSVLLPLGVGCTRPSLTGSALIYYCGSVPWSPGMWTLWRPPYDAVYSPIAPYTQAGVRAPSRK